MIRPSKIELYYVESDYAEHWLDMDLLSAVEKIRYDQYKYVRDAKNFLIARNLLKTILGEKFKLAPSAIELSISSAGKPYLSTRYAQPLDKNHSCFQPGLSQSRLSQSNQPQFSIAHCDGAVVVAISTESVGVDIENIQRPSQPWKKAQRIINARAAKTLKGLSDTDAEYNFARYWTCLEAYVKLMESSIAKERHQFFLEEAKELETLTFSKYSFSMTEFKPSRLCALSFAQEKPEILRYVWGNNTFSLS